MVWTPPKYVDTVGSRERISKNKRSYLPREGIIFNPADARSSFFERIEWFRTKKSGLGKSCDPVSYPGRVARGFSAEKCVWGYSSRSDTFIGMGSLATGRIEEK